MTLRIKRYLQSNNGDGYIGFLVLFTVIVLLFSTVFSTMKTTVEMRAIYSEVESASDIVISKMKIDGYESLMDGTTEDVDLLLSDAHVLHILNDALGGTIENQSIVKKNTENSNASYIIHDIRLINHENGLVTISFEIDVPIYYNGALLSVDTTSYQKTSQITFKDAVGG